MRLWWDIQKGTTTDVAPGACTEVPLSRLQELKEVITSEDIPRETVWKTKRIVINSTTYRVGDFFVLDVVHGEEVPIFVKILHIVKYRGQWLACGRVYTSTHFDEHLHVYCVQDTRKWVAFKPGVEADFQPLDAYTDVDNLLITLHHKPLSHGVLED